MNETMTYNIELTDGSIISGSTPFSPGDIHVTCSIHSAHIRSVRAEVTMTCTEDEMIFLNGFQTWSYCPEYSSRDRIRDLKHLPKAAVQAFGLERYGDYYFVDYPNKRGQLHGESYGYIRRGEHFRLFASLSEETGYTILRYDANEQILSLERDCAGLFIDGEFHAFDLYYAEGSEEEVFDGWFKAMNIRPVTRERIKGYSSWYNRYQNISEIDILRDLSGCGAVMENGDLFQIDDGWEKTVGDWEPDNVKFPEGLKKLADSIHEKGFKAGLWLAPFVAQKSSVIYKNHPDWFIRFNGKPWYCGVNWGGFFALDMDHPDVREYLIKIFDRVFNEWGFDLVKLDFLYAAAPLNSEKESRAGRMYRAIRFLRELCGNKLILGCGVPLMPAFGMVDYCRVSCDVGLDWNDSKLMQQIHRERVSTKQAIENTIFRRELNNRAWGSDPDVFFLRDENIKLTDKQKNALAKCCALFGNVLLTSDDMGLYDEIKLRRYQELLKLRDAKDIRITNKGGLSVQYRLGDIVHTLQISP